MKSIEVLLKASRNAQPSIPDDLAYLEGQQLEDYLHDMKIAQEYAIWNREAMLDVTFTTARDSSTLFTDIPTSVFEKKIAARLAELDNRSNMLKSKGQVCLEVCELNGFNSYELFQQFILPSCIKYNIPVEQDGKFIKVGK